MAGEPVEFYVVWALRCASDGNFMDNDFTIEAILSKKEDAELMEKVIEKKSFIVERATSIELLPIETITELLIKDRLGKMADVLRPIIEKTR